MPRSRTKRRTITGLRTRPLAGLERLEAREQPSASMLGNLNTTPQSAFNSFGDSVPYLGGPQAGAVVGGSVVFAASDGANATEIWKSDGTAAGTALVAALPDGGLTPTPYALSGGFTAAGGKAYFSYNDNTHGNELWVTDGTAAGTHIVADLTPGATGSNPQNLNAVGGRLVFTAADAAHPELETLYATDGTAAGTVSLTGLTMLTTPGFLTAGGSLYFDSRTIDPNTSEATDAIWVSDGTQAGTHAAVTLPAGTTADVRFYSNWLAAVGTRLYFTATDQTAGSELWTSDGTVAGTRIVKDINTTTPQPEPWFIPVDGPNGSSSPQQLTAVGGTLYFTADDGVQGQELWTSDGTDAGTRMVADLSPGVGSVGGPLYGTDGTGSQIKGLTAVGAKLYFSADDGTHGPQLYVSDGTAAGTITLTSVTHSSSGPGPVALTGAENPVILSAAGGQVFFSIGDSADGRQLWATDGTAAGTHLIKIIGSTSDLLDQFGRGPGPLGAVGGKLLFQADDNAHGRQLWATDGTAAGTAIVKYLNPGDEGSFASQYVAAGGTVYFTAVTGDGTAGLYATDGTAAPRLVMSFAGGPTAAGQPPVLPHLLTAVGGDLYFVGRAGSVGLRLYKSNGTAGGTTVVKEIARPADAGVADSYGPLGIDNPTAVGGTLFFTLDLPAVGQQLWKTDGTAAGTTLVRQLNAAYTPPNPPPGASPPTPTPLGYEKPAVHQMTAVGTNLFFVADDDTRGAELWVSDGTAAGTKVVADINPGPAGSGPADLTALNGKLYFTAQDGAHGRQLWVSDGTAAGTKLAATISISTASDLYAGPPRTIDGPEPRRMVASGGRLFLTGTDAAHGTQLWTSDGTAGGTHRVTQLPAAYSYPGSAVDPAIDGLTAAGGKVYFSAGDPTLRRQLWVTDGTAAGTKMLGPIGDGKQGPTYENLGANPVVLAATASGLLFTADDGMHGRELWATDGTAAGTRLVHDLFPGTGSGAGMAGRPATRPW